jgi:uncharacterized protein YkwD
MRRLSYIIKIIKPFFSACVIVIVVLAAGIYCGNSDSFFDSAGVYDESVTEAELIGSAETESLVSETEGETSIAETKADRTTQKKSVPASTYAATTVTTTAPRRFTLTPQFSKSAYINTVVKLTNKYREEAGVGKLSTDFKLMNAAQTRAEECASIDNIRVDGKPHTRPDGSKWYTVLGIAENYNYGENTGQGCDTPEYMMDIWMSSEGHRDNIQNEEYTKIGVGCAVSEDGTVYCVQIFYKP